MKKAHITHPARPATTADDRLALLADEALRQSSSLCANQALCCNILIPAAQVKVEVKDGWATLTGDVDWHYQRKIAERAVKEVPDLRGVRNEINVDTCESSYAAKSQEAVKRNIETRARAVRVTFDADSIALRGKVTPGGLELASVR